MKALRTMEAAVILILCATFAASQTATSAVPEYQSVPLKLERNSVFDDVFSDGNQWALIYHKPGKPEKRWVQTPSETYELTSSFVWGDGTETYFEYTKNGQQYLHWKTQDFGPYSKVSTFIIEGRHGAATLQDGTWSLGMLGENPIFTGIPAQKFEGFNNEGLLKGWLSVVDHATKFYSVTGVAATLPFDISDRNQFSRIQVLSDGRALIQYRTSSGQKPWTLGLWDGNTIVASWPMDANGWFEVWEQYGATALTISPVFDGKTFEPPHTVIDLGTSTILAQPDKRPSGFFVTSKDQIGFTAESTDGNTIYVGKNKLTLSRSAAANSVPITTEKGSVVWGIAVRKTVKDKKGVAHEELELFYEGKSLTTVQSVISSFSSNKQAYLVVTELDGKFSVYKDSAKVFGPVERLGWEATPVDGQPIWMWVTSKGTKSLYKDFKPYAGPFADAENLELMADGTPVYVVSEKKGQTVYRGNKPLGKQAPNTVFQLSKDRASVIHAEWDGKVGSILVDGKAVISGQKCSWLTLLGRVSDGTVIWEKTDDKNRKYLMYNDRAEIQLLGPYNFNSETEVVQFDGSEGRDQEAYRTLSGEVARGFAVYPVSEMAIAKAARDEAAQSDPKAPRIEFTQLNQTYSVISIYYGTKLFSQSRGFYTDLLSNGEVQLLGICAGEAIFKNQSHLVWGNTVIGDIDRFGAIPLADSQDRIQVDWAGKEGRFPMIWGRSGESQDPGRAIVINGKVAGWVTLDGFAPQVDDGGTQNYTFKEGNPYLTIYSSNYVTAK